MSIDFTSTMSGCRSTVYQAALLRRVLCQIILAGTVVCLGVEPSSANEFVGVLTLALEDDVAREIGLPPSTQAKLRDLVDRRETEALELAYEARELSAAEQAKRLAPFRTESEKLGLALLTQQQRDNLEAIRIARKGMASLAEEKVADALELTDQQRAELTRLLGERQAATQELDRRSAERERKAFEIQLKALLAKEQLDAWQKLSTPIASPVAGEKDATSKASDVVASLSVPGKSSGKAAMRFSFRYAPWGEVIEWFAEQAGLSLIMDAPPQGTLNYSDRREYTPSEAIDLLNSVLLTKGYTLVRRERMLMVINLEDGIPPNLVTEVSVDQLDERGEYELVRCLFTLHSASATDVEEEISRLIGPQGAIAVLDSSNQLLVTETAGRLRTFRTIIEAAERKNEVALGESSLIALAHVRAADVIASWRKLMGLTEEENSTPDGSLRVAQGKSSRKLIVSGREDRVREFKDLVQLLDVPAAGGNGIDVPQLEVYPITDADPTSVLEVTQTLMADEDDVRLASDPKSGNLVVLARPAQQRTIKTTIDQMQRDRREVEVIRLGIVDPQLAMMSIEKLFGPPEGEEGVIDTNALRVDADPTSRSLLIRGAQSQIADIRALLAKMGETDMGSGDRSLVSGRGNLRMIPIDAGTARRALDQMNSIWPAVRKNTIRVLTPSSTIRRIRPDSDSPPETLESPLSDPLDETTSTTGKSRYVNATREVTERDERPVEPTEYPDVIVTPGDQGLLIASEDLEALDDFEQVFRTLADRLFIGSRELAVFYLKHAKAEVAAELLKQLLGRGGSSSTTGGSGALLGKLAGAALGGGDGGLIGSLLGMGGDGSATTMISGGTTIIADDRLNALVVQAPPKDLDHIEQMLKLLDASASPEAIETIPKPRTIPVLHTSAEEIAEIVRSVYASRLAGGGGKGSTRREPSPEEVIRALSGQKDNDRTIKDAVGEQLRMNVSVDKRRNSLIVVAPDWLFEEVEELVAQLDVAAPDQEETVRVVQTTVSPETVRNALASIIGETTTSPTTSQDSPAGAKAKGATEPPKPPSDARSIEQMKRRMEFLKALQRANGNKKDAKAKAVRK